MAAVPIQGSMIMHPPRAPTKRLTRVPSCCSFASLVVQTELVSLQLSSFIRCQIHTCKFPAVVSRGILGDENCTRSAQE